MQDFDAESYNNKIMSVIRDEEEFLREFKNQHKEANQWVYHLAFGPYYPNMQKTQVEDSGKDTPPPRNTLQMSDGGSFDPEGSKTPDMDTPDLTSDMDDLPEEKNENEYVFLPQYRNLYQFGSLRNMPKLLRINDKYELSELGLRRLYNPLGKMYVSELLKRKASLTNVCLYYKKNLIKDTPLCWIGDGRFTGHGNHLYFFKKDPQSTKLILQKQNISDLNKLCDDIMKLNNALSQARYDDKNKYTEELLYSTLMKLQELPQVVQKWKPPQGKRKGYADKRNEQKRQRRRYVMNMPLKF